MTYTERITFFGHRRSGHWPTRLCRACPPFWLVGPSEPCLLCDGTHFERIGDGEIWQCRVCKLSVSAPQAVNS